MIVRGATAVVGLALAVTAAPAAASTQFGDVSAPATGSCAPGTIYYGSAPSQVAPSSGIITSFSLNRTAAGGRVAFKTLRSQGANKIVAAAGPLVNVGAGVTSYPARVSVIAGDQLAVWTADAETCLAADASSSVGQNPFSIDPGPGTVFTPGVPTPLSKVVVAANIEADANGDGYGDETQQCRVPQLKKLSVTQAKAALVKGGCKLGTTKKKKLRKFTKSNKKNRIRSQTIGVGAVKPIGAIVDITVNVKKKIKHHKK